MTATYGRGGLSASRASDYSVAGLWEQGPAARILAEAGGDNATPLPHYARRTERLDGWFTYVSFALGGEAGARLAGRLGMKASPSTLLQRLHGVALASLPPPEVIGVDDFAIPKSISCGVVRGFGTFMTGLKREQSTVAAAFLSTYGNGQTEGQISRLKTLKGQMCGRASFGLLRRRVLGVV